MLLFDGAVVDVVGEMNGILIVVMIDVGVGDELTRDSGQDFDYLDPMKEEVRVGRKPEL